MRIAIGSDHRGYEAKEKIKVMLISKGYEVLDFGAECAASCDYPDAAYPTCKSVVSGVSESGILLCGSGIGMSISANKVRGIRAALIHDHFSAKQGVEDDHMNVICLGGRTVGPDVAWDLVRAFLEATYSQESRHLRRLGKVAFIEAARSAG